MKHYIIDQILLGRNQGINTTTEKVRYSDFGYRIVQAKNVNRYNFTYDEDNYINEQTFSRIKDNHKLKRGDLLFSNIGSQMGNSCVYDSDEEAVITWNVLKMEPDNNIVDTDYLCFWFNWKSQNIRALNSSSTMPFVSGKVIGKLNIELPSVENQKRVSSILSVINKKIALNEKINDNLLQQASTIYQAWFEEFVPFEGECPPSWKEGTLADIANISSGKRPPVKSAEKTDIAVIPLVGAASVMGYTTEANHTDKILVTGRVGTHGVVQRFNSPCWTSDNTLVITSPLYEYTYQILQRIDYNSMNRGSTQPLITQGDMNKVSILIPDQETLHDFETLVGKLMDQYEANLLENNKLAELRDTLLPKLMSGELDVSDIDS